MGVHQLSVINLIAELRRRNVFRAALAYLAAAWLIIQLINEIGPILNAPEWLPKVVLALLGGGFLVVIILSWIYELTTEGIRTTTEVDRDESLHAINGRALDFFVIGLLLLALGYFIWESRFSADAVAGTEIRSVAVLPFRDLSAGRDQAYFAEGVAEELLDALSRVPGLKVAGRTSSFSFRNSDLDSEVIAKQLKVSHLLEGSVRTSGGQLRVTAQLVNSRDGFQLWSHEFEGPLVEVFAIQDQISQRVIESLKASIEGTPTSPSPVARPKTDIAAYNEYLLGRYQIARRTSESIAQAQVHFEAAVEIDPDFSPAWSALATALAVSPWYGGVADLVETGRLARQAAQRALALDKANSEAWAALGTVFMTFDRDWKEAERALKRAVELNPNDAGNANLYGDYLYVTGDYREAEKWEHIAAELEPLSAAHQHELALVYGLTARTREAIELELKAVELSPGFRNGWRALGRFYAESADVEKLEELLQTQGERWGEVFSLSLDIRLQKLKGETRTAFEQADKLRRLARDGRVGLIVSALSYAILGDGEAAAELVREAQLSANPLLISPIYFFLPEDWSHLPNLEAALKIPDLEAVHDLRRASIAAGRGRVCGSARTREQASAVVCSEN